MGHNRKNTSPPDAANKSETNNANSTTQIHCPDAVIMRIRNHFGHAWSPKFGRIFFKRKNVVNINGRSISQVAPGKLKLMAVGCE